MNDHYELGIMQEELLQDKLVRSREGLSFIVDKSENFLQNRQKSYLKKVIQTHINFRHDLLNKNKTKRQFLQKFLKVKWRGDSSSKTLGVCFAFTFLNNNERFEYDHLSSIIRRHLPGIRVEEAYFCRFSQEDVVFCYAEIEKIRGFHLSLQESLNLKKIFQQELVGTIETTYSDLFMPTNEEEIYKHIASLSNDVSSLSSLPHIMISFVKQDHDVLYFNVVLVRAIQIGDASFEKIAKSLPFKVRIYVNKTSLKDSLLKEVCVFSAEIKNKDFKRKNFSIDYLKARRYLSLTLEEHIGEFRDCNGGLLIKQCEQLDQVVKDLAGKIENFSTIEELFFSFVPSSTQTLISANVALKLYHHFCRIKEVDYNSLYKMEYSEEKDALIIFIKTNNEKVKTFLYSIVLDDNFLAAYTKKTIENQTYFCFLEINPSDLSFLLKLKKGLHDLEKNYGTLARDTLRIPLQEGLPPSLHPHFLTDTNSFTLGKALYEGLTRINLEGKVEYAIAENIDVSSCKKRYLITLKSTRWSNGEPLLADHFVNAWKKAIASNSRCLRPHLFYVIKNAEKVFNGTLSSRDLGIKKQSNFEILVELEYPALYFPELLANPVFSPLYDFNDEEPNVFNGPFKLNSYQKNREINLLKNDFYWDTSTVKLKKISFLLIKDTHKIIEMFYNSDLDWVGSPFSNILQKNLRHQSSFQVKEAYVPFWLHCNTKNPKLASAKIRNALSLAIDRSKIGNEILPGQMPTSRIIPKSLSLIDLPEENYEKNLEKAKQLFQEGLKEIKYDLNDFSLTLSYSDHTNSQGCLAFYLKHLWESAFGIQVILKELEWDTHWNNLFNGEFEVGGACRFPNYLDIYCFLESFFLMPTNYSKWTSNDFQKWLNLSKNALSLDIQKKILKKAEQSLQENMPVIPIYNRTHLYLQNSRVKKLLPSTLAYMDFKWAYFE